MLMGNTGSNRKGSAKKGSTKKYSLASSFGSNKEIVGHIGKVPNGNKYRYYVSKSGATEQDRKTGKKTVLKRVKREEGFLYFIDGSGNIGRSPMARH